MERTQPERSSAPSELLSLVRRFGENYQQYKSPLYKEAELRREFVDPLFRILGWDVENSKGLSEAYKEVVYEPALRVGEGVKAPDYSFRLGGVRQFFVEAKKPSVNLRQDLAPAFQLRRYAWSAGLSVSVLTDFEELAVYDCRAIPNELDGAFKGRAIYLSYEQYVDRWDEIVRLFSRSAVEAGSLRTFVRSLPRLRGLATVDGAFLGTIERWRSRLARVIVRSNPGLSISALNFAVQATIDRLVFLRICEDRGIEPHGQLLGIVSGPGTYGRLLGLLRRADDRYNSGLFHFGDERGRLGTPDTLTPSLSIDDDVLRDIIRNLYYPESPYEFSVIPAEILGQVYEQFLGQVLVRDERGGVAVEEKPEVRKAGGVYYTPKHVVDYIVRQAIGPMLNGRRVGDVADLRFVDPACGSGSFLIAVYQYLLDWYLEQFLSESSRKHRTQTFRTESGEWRLTPSARKEILLRHVYGVDIDPQAVEVTKLSLLMKVLEGESAESVSNQLRLFHERALPDLELNVKCGNSLIGWDVLRLDGETLDDETRRRLNPFDWHREFPGAFGRDNPGFDSVVGNPPYIFGEYLDARSKVYFRSKFKVATGQLDAYWLFVERSLHLLREGGRFSMVLPDALLARDEAAKVRGLLLDDGLERVYHCGFVFSNAGVSAAVISAQRDNRPARVFVDIRVGATALEHHDCDRKRFERDPLHRFLVHASDEEDRILERVSEGSVLLRDVPVRVTRGEELGKRRKEKDAAIPILVGEDISRYDLRAPSRHAAVAAKDPRIYAPPKLVMVKTGAHCIVALDTVGYVTMQSVYNLHIGDSSVDPRVLLAVLNSTVIDFYLLKSFTAYKLLFPQLNQTTVEELPVPRAALSVRSDLPGLVEQTIALRASLVDAETKFDRERITRNVVALDAVIDSKVAAMYGLTPAEEGSIRASIKLQELINGFARQRLEAMSGLTTMSQADATDLLMSRVPD